MWMYWAWYVPTVVALQTTYFAFDCARVGIELWIHVSQPTTDPADRKSVKQSGSNVIRFSRERRMDRTIDQPGQGASARILQLPKGLPRASSTDSRPCTPGLQSCPGI
jgi:hypothetical protein